ncbi:MAG: hypothetical protein QM674_08785 [Burkholderiaceae bacterium]
MAGNWGIALNAAVNGALRGFDLRNVMDRNKRDTELRDLEMQQRRQAMADQGALRQSQQDIAPAEETRVVSTPGGGQWSEGGTLEQKAWKVGSQLFDSQQAAKEEAMLQNSRGAKQQRAADVLRSQGRLEAAGKLEDQLAAWKQEGMDKAMDTILAGGDGASAVETYNSIGKHKLGKGDGVTVLRRYQHQRPGFAPMDDAEVEVNIGGQKTVISSVLAARHKIDPYAVARQGYASQRDEAKDAKDDRRLTLAEQAQATRDRMADQRERMNDARLGQIEAGVRLANARAAGLESGSGGAGDRGVTHEQQDKWDSALESRAKGLFPEPEFGASAEDLSRSRQARNQWKLMALDTLTYARSNGQPMSVEFASQAAQEAMANPKARGLKDLGNGLVVPVVSFQGKTVQVGAPMDKPQPAPAQPEAPPARSTAARPSPGAQLAAAAKPDFAERPLSPEDQAAQADLDRARVSRAAAKADAEALRAITPAQINKMSAAEAEAILKQYGNRLSGRQAAAIRARMAQQ